MSLNAWFWIIYVVAVIFGWWGMVAEPNSPWWRRSSGLFVLFVLVGILGYHEFGPALRQ